MPAPFCVSCSASASAARVIKFGLTASGHQVYQCKGCLRRFTMPKERGYNKTMRLRAVQYVLEGMSLRRAAHLLRVNHQSVANWVKAYQEMLEQQGQTTLPSPIDAPELAHCQTIELDELYTFVGCKKNVSTSLLP